MKRDIFKFAALLFFLFLPFTSLNAGLGWGEWVAGDLEMYPGEGAGSWDDDGWGYSDQNRYSLVWNEQVCRAKTGWEVGYFTSESLDPDNSDGSFTPVMKFAYAHYGPVMKLIFPQFHKMACISWGKYNKITVPPNTSEAKCEKIGGLYNACFTAAVAPFSKRTLYTWLAKIQRGRTKEKNMPERLKAVIDGDNDAINSGYESFADINMDWVDRAKIQSDENAIKRYIAKFPGQKMVCARLTTILGIGGGDDECSLPEECLAPKELDYLLKCTLVPMGPAPHPMTPYIVGEAAIYAAYHLGSTYDKPKVRIIYFEYKDGVNEKKVLNCEGVGGNGGSNVCKDSTYEIDVKVDDKKICSYLKKVGNKDSGNYKLGCYDRGINISKIPDLYSVPKKPGSDPWVDVNLSVKYPWKSGTNKEVAVIQPINSARYVDIAAMGDCKNGNLNCAATEAPEINETLTALQFGFNRNPNKKNFDWSASVKKKCDYSKPDGTDRISRYIRLDETCESYQDMVAVKEINIFKCNRPGILVESEEKCVEQGLLSAGSIPIKGTKCKNGQFVEFGKKCQDIAITLFYDNDPDGQNICLRDFQNGAREYQSVIRDDGKGGKKVVSFSTNPKVLMVLDENGNVDFNQSNFFVSINSWTQDELDYMRPTGDDMFTYDKDGVKKRYMYGPMKIQTGPDKSQVTDLSDEFGRPFYLTDDEIRDNGVYIGDPFTRGLCKNIAKEGVLTKEWDYVLQMPGYYSNYDIKNDSDIVPIKGKLSEVPGGILAKTAANDNTQFDSLKNKVILIPTDYANSSNPLSDAVVGIADESINRIIQNAKLKSKPIVHSSLGIDVKSLNFYPDFFDKVIKANKIMYLNGNALNNPGGNTDMNKNLFDTSQCNVIDFEIWGGGSASRAAKNSGAAGIFDFTKASSGINICNTHSSGQNGAYVKGRFKIRKNTKLKILVGSASGLDSKTPNIFDAGSPDLKSSDGLDKSAIWVTDGLDNNVIIASSDNGSDKHDCEKFGEAKCKSLLQNDLIKKAIDNNVKLVELDDRTKREFTRYGNGSDNIVSLERPIDPDLTKRSFNEHLIQVDAYRNVSMSSYCGANVSGGKLDLFSTLPLSDPVNIHTYVDDNDITNRDGYKLENGILDFSRAAGSGIFGEVGSYYFVNTALGDSALSKKFGFGINWVGRVSGNAKYAKCDSRIRACYGMGKFATAVVDNKVIYGGNASGVIGLDDTQFFNNILSQNTIDPNNIKNLVTDMNIYCPGTGGCSFSNNDKGISEPGVGGLVKIKCFRI